MRAAYVWDEPYKAAILETDDKKLPSLLQAAKAVIDKRLQDMRPTMAVRRMNDRLSLTRLLD